MSCGAVICEYDPFHLGHAYLLSEMRKQGEVICLMSGNFTQRGEPALLSKYERARLAVLGGADLVLELPFPFSSARADLFASAGVALLSATGVTERLMFGSECGDVERLSAVAFRMGSEAFARSVEEELSEGHHVSYREAFSKGFESLGGETLGSNDRLALFYLAALKKQNSPILPQTVKRMGADFDGKGEGFASASAIRRGFLAGDFETVKKNVPSAVYDALLEAKEAGEIARAERLFSLYACRLRTMGERAFLGVPDVPTELAARLVRGGLHAKNTEELLAAAGTRRYSPSRLRRSLLHMLLGVTEEDLSLPTFTVVLAANEKGRALLSRMRKESDIDILTKPSDYKLCRESTKRGFSLLARADSVYALLTDAPADGASMLLCKPYLL